MYSVLVLSTLCFPTYPSTSTGCSGHIPQQTDLGRTHTRTTFNRNHRRVQVFSVPVYNVLQYSSTPVRHSTWYSSTGVQYVIFVRVLMYSFVLEYCTVQRTHTICTTVLDYSTVRRTHRYFCCVLKQTPCGFFVLQYTVPQSGHTP